MILLAMLLPLPTAAAPAATVEIISQGTESHFPEDLTFTLHARSDEGDITAARVYVEPGWTEPSRLLRATDFAPASEVELTAVWDTTAETIPPFLALRYYWELEFTDGTTFTTSPVETEYVDHTHDWQRLEDENVILLWYDRDQTFGETLFNAARESYAHVTNITGVDTDQAVRIVIYNNQDDFCAFYSRGNCQDWIGGVSLPELGMTAQWGRGVVWFAEDVIPHELAHLFYMGEIFADTWVDVPTWFNEGIAVYNERHDHSQARALVQQAAEDDELVPLRLMNARGGSVVDNQVGAWYAQAWSLVDFLAETYGEDTLGEIILLLGDNVLFEDALQETTGLDMVALELAWREWLGYPIDSVPTPISLPTMAVTPFGLPSRDQGTATPRPSSDATAEPEPSPTPASIAEGGEPEQAEEQEEETGLPAVCLGPFGLVLAVLLWIGLRRL
jgi:hypothetical protein